MKHNTVKAVFVRKSSNTLYYVFFDNQGKLKYRSTGLKATKRNRRYAQAGIAAFEAKLRELAEHKRKRQHSFSYYCSLYLAHNEALAKISVYKSRLKIFLAGNLSLRQKSTG